MVSKTFSYFGPAESPDEASKERLNLLDGKEKNEIEQLVARKMEEKKTRILAWDPDEYTVEFRHELDKRRAEARKAEVDEGQKVEYNGVEDEVSEIEARTDALGISGTDNYI